MALLLCHKRPLSTNVPPQEDWYHFQEALAPSEPPKTERVARLSRHNKSHIFFVAVIAGTEESLNGR